MLTSVEFENYRGFQRLKVEGLSRVNLITGYNNSGKTSLLEGLHLLASGGEASVLIETAVRRGEVSLSQEQGESLLPNVAHLFHGHEIDVGDRVMLRGSNGVPSIGIEIWPENDPALIEFLGNRDGYLAFDFALSIVRQCEETRTLVAAHPMLPSGEILPDRRGRGLHSRRQAVVAKNGMPTRFLPSSSLDTSALRDMWDHVLVEGREQRVYEALRIIEPDLTDVVFLQGSRPVRNGDATGILVRSGDSSIRQPLGSSGEGMHRLLALGLCLSEAAGGMLLIDEVDTGLHWSVMPDMWKLVIETAIRTDTQVFATTHSIDCIRALARLCEDNPQYGEHISAQKLHRSLDHSVPLDARQLMIAVEQEIEVR